MTTYPFEECLLCDERIDGWEPWDIPSKAPAISPPKNVTEESFFNGPPNPPKIDSVRCMKLSPCGHVFREDDIDDICELLQPSQRRRGPKLDPNHDYRVSATIFSMLCAEAKRNAEKLNDGY